MEGFQVGDTVRLKSGGSLMTVAHIYFDEEDSEYWIAECVWLDVEKLHHREKFTFPTLIKSKNIDIATSPEDA